MEHKFRPICLNRKWGFIDEQGNCLPGWYDGVKDFSDGYAPVKANRKWGYIDEQGNMVIEPMFNEVKQFRQCNLAPVRIDNLWGYIDVNGNMVIDMQYDDAYYFYQDRAAVVKDNIFGFIDTKGVLVIDFKYQYVENFSHSRSKVRVPDSTKYGCIDLYGRQVTMFMYDDFDEDVYDDDVEYFVTQRLYRRRQAGYIDPYGFIKRTE